MSAPAANASPVMAHNEWDPLEEVIVGRLDGAVLPERHVAVSRTIPAQLDMVLRFAGGRRYPWFLVEPAQRELEGLIALLRSLGVTVRQPDPLDGRRWITTPWWRSRGFMTACPRDGFLVVGDEIIETPMAWRCRYHEGLAYRRLFRGYHAAGARWTIAPRPELRDELFDPRYRLPKHGPPLRYVVNELEPVFDAADFVRCGRDLFVLRSHVTNGRGIAWLRRHLGPGYRIHPVESRCANPMHIDSTFMPLAPGKVLINPDHIDPDRLPACLEGWDVLVAPRPDPAQDLLLSMCSAWLSMNLLMLDTRRVLVEAGQPSMIRALEGWGFEPIPCAFAHYAAFGGSFHCATLDVRRRGGLEDYFPRLSRGGG
jgi:glycine amidinotransferase